VLDLNLFIAIYSLSVLLLRTFSRLSPLQIARVLAGDLIAASALCVKYWLTAWKIRVFLFIDGV
jgi:hypothetical protein